MKKLFFFAALFAAVSINAQEPVEKVLSEVANYVDFQALYEADATLVDVVPTSTTFVTLPNGTILKGFQKGDGSETTNSWNTKPSYNTTMPTPDWAGVDSLKAGTMFRAGSNSTIELGAFNTTADGKLYVYFQPNGDSERGVSCSIFEGTPVEVKKSGVKIGGIRPAYAAEFELEAGAYEAGDVVLKVLANTCNIFGIGIENLGASGLNNALTNAEKTQKMMLNGQLVIVKDGKYFNALGAEMK